MCRQGAVNTGFRQVERKDRELLFEWANDSEVRRQSFQTGNILWEDHVRWFEERMRSEDCALLIWVEDGVDKGMLRLDARDGKAYVSYSVGKEWRGNGIASRMIDALPAYVKTAMPGIHTVVAEVKAENRFSRRIFEKCGYRQETREDRIIYTLDIRPESIP